MICKKRSHWHMLNFYKTEEVPFVSDFREVFHDEEAEALLSFYSQFEVLLSQPKL